MRLSDDDLEKMRLAGADLDLSAADLDLSAADGDMLEAAAYLKSALDSLEDAKSVPAGIMGFEVSI
jgi:hypothetical protein